MNKLFGGALFLGLSVIAQAATAADLGPYGMIAQPVPPPPPQMWGWEIRGGVLAHDPTSPEAGSADLNGELLFPQLWHADGFWGSLIPHPDVGFTANFVGKTSQVYGGAAWNFELWNNFFYSSDAGMGLNNGKTGISAPPGFNRVGCDWWFHESASLGYHLTSNWSVMGTIEHSSNAGLCVQNRGVTNYGLRIGYKF